MTQYKSPAKVNLFLKILGRRSDGYHELASLFQAVSLYDLLEVKLAESDLLTCSESDIPCDDTNLVVMARNLFREKTGYSEKISIHLEKHIPHQAGLGGGSSNAATTLWALNEISGLGVSIDELSEWGSELGSDVPFFLTHGSAYCTGRGECLEELEQLSGLAKLWIVKPNFGMSTIDVYKNFDAERLVDRDPRVDLQRFVCGGFVFYNDLQLSAFNLKPDLQKLKTQLLSNGFESVLMSGSGSALFCVGEGSVEGMWNQQVELVRRSKHSWY